MIRRTFVTIAVALTAVTATVAMAAVAQTGRQPPAGPATATVPAGGARITLPLDAYQLTPTESVRVDRARRSVITACLRRFGFDPPSPAAEPQPPDSLNTRRYGVVDPQTASRYGYHPPYGAQHPGGWKPRNAGEQTAMSGEGPSKVNGIAVPPGGCFGVADRELNRGAPTVPDAHLVYRLGAESYQRAKEDPRLQGAFERWSACVRRAGHTYADPTVVVADPRFQTPTATPDEIAVAQADVACKIEIDLVPLWVDVETFYQLSLVGPHRPALETIQELNRVQVANAGRILGRRRGQPNG